MRGTVFTPEIVLPVNSPPLNNSSIAVLNGKIVDVGLTTEIKKSYPGYKFKELINTIILPGFINAHVHLELGWIKQRIKNSRSFINWLEQLISAKSQDIKKTDITRSVERGISELVKSGVTTVGEISSYGGLDIPLLKDSGLRCVLFKEIVDSKSSLLDTMTFESGGIYEERPFPHAPYSCSPQLLAKTIDIASTRDIPLSIHLAESTDEVKFVKKEENGFERVIYPMIGKTPFKRRKAVSPLRYLLKFLKGKKVLLSAVHMVQTDKNDLKLIDDKISIILCPRSNMLIKAGIPKVELIKDIERTGLGTDGLSSNLNLNFFEEIKTVNQLLAEKEINDSHYYSVYFATLGGARALFIEDRVGSIEKGKDADLICIDYKMSGKNPYESLVKSRPEDIVFSMVRGSFIYQRN